LSRRIFSERLVADGLDRPLLEIAHGSLGILNVYFPEEIDIVSEHKPFLSEDVLKVQMLVALATEVAATEAKPAVAGDKTLTLR
jgi:hypothetical protein